MKKFGTVFRSNDGFASKKFESGLYNGFKVSQIIKLILAKNVVIKQANRGGSFSLPWPSPESVRPFFKALINCCQIWTSFSRLKTKIKLRYRMIYDYYASSRSYLNKWNSKRRRQLNAAIRIDLSSHESADNTKHKAPDRQNFWTLIRDSGANKWLRTGNMKHKSYTVSISVTEQLSGYKNGYNYYKQ